MGTGRDEDSALDTGTPFLLGNRFLGSGEGSLLLGRLKLTTLQSTIGLFNDIRQPRAHQQTRSAPLHSPPSLKTLERFGGISMRQQMRGALEAGLLLCALILSAECSSVSPQASVEPSCKKRAQPPEVRAGAQCKDIESPVLIDCVDPNYPPDVRKQRLEGKVVAKAALTPDATLEDLRIVSSPSTVLSNLALEAFRQWRYKPAFCRELGKSIRVSVTMTATFNLR